MKMQAFALLGALALASGSGAAAAGPKGLAEDVAEIATRVCVGIESGRLGWNPADPAAEEALFRSVGLKSGIPSGTLDGFGRFAASTFNRSALAHRANGASHVLVAIGGQMPGCRVSVAGVPGVISGPEVARALQHQAYGWTPVPELGRNTGAIERLTFVRRAEGAGPLLLDVLVVNDPRGSFRLMAIVMRPPAGTKLPAGF